MSNRRRSETESRTSTKRASAPRAATQRSRRSPASTKSALACFERIFKDGPLGIAATSPDGRLVAASPALCKMLGYSESALLKQQVVDLLEPDKVSGKTATIERVIGVRSLPATVERQFRCKNGTLTWARVTLAQVGKKADGASHLLMVEDINAQKHAEHAQRRAQQTSRERERFLEAIVENIPDMIFVKDCRTLRFLRFNRAGEELIGYTREELIGRSDHDFYPKEEADFFTQVDRDVLASGKLHTVSEERITTRYHGERLLHTKKIPIFNADGHPQYLLGISEDVTDQRQLQARMAQADRMASIGLLAAGVAHEINNPLTYVLYNLTTLAESLPALAEAIQAQQLMLDNAGRGPVPLPAGGTHAGQATSLAEVIDKVEGAVEGAQRVKQIVQDLKTFSRAEDDRLEPLSINQVIDGAINMAFNEIKYRARLVKAYGDVPPLLGNDGRLAQVFLNLLVNAAQAIEEGEAERNEIRIRTCVDGDDIVADVSDTGKGMPTQVLEHLFEPFFTTKQEGIGFGLGLSICRNIVDGLGGRIDVESELGRGTRFTVRLPLHREHATTRPAQTRSRPISVAPMDDRLRMLVIDDEPYVATAIAQMLGQQGETITVYSGNEAKSILRRDMRFDAIICDLMMPTVTGMDLHGWLVSRKSRLANRMIFVTGGVFTPRAKAFLNRIPNARLEKPFERDTIVGVLRSLTQMPSDSGVGPASACAGVAGRQA